MHAETVKVMGTNMYFQAKCACVSGKRVMSPSETESVTQAKGAENVLWDQEGEEGLATFS